MFEQKHIIAQYLSKSVPIHQGEEVQLLLIIDLSSRWGEWSALRLVRALPRGKDPRYPLYRRLGGPLNRSGHRG
jgi:hypothetical protein